MRPKQAELQVECRAKRREVSEVESDRLMLKKHLNLKQAIQTVVVNVVLVVVDRRSRGSCGLQLNVAGE